MHDLDIMQILLLRFQIQKADLNIDQFDIKFILFALYFLYISFIKVPFKLEKQEANIN